jgi:hypothetical protein|tara:strand:- start:2984 stop:3475 length:492 start_codon:yes stop_codon:yes gene_type:complete
MKNNLILALLTATLSATAVFAVAAISAVENATNLSVTNAHIRAMPPGQSKTAGFLAVTNNGTKICQLTSAKSTFSDRLEFHEHQHDQGMMKMRPVARVVVPPGETVVFAPGGLHLMLFNLTEAPQAGDITQIQLFTDQCGSVSFDAKVRSLVKKSMSMDGMHH